MKLLGLIGGMSWENTIDYYKIINSMVKERLGGWNSAKILLYSVNFEEILSLQNDDRWDAIGRQMINISKSLESAGAQAILICSNTMHRVADAISSNVSIPLIHVVDETAKSIKKQDLKTIGLLGTRFTMEGGFYADRLNHYDLKVILPDIDERYYIHDKIYNEFAQGNFPGQTKQRFLSIIDGLILRGAQGIILGCTELPMLIKPEDVKIPLFDTLILHLKAAIDYILNDLSA